MPGDSRHPDESVPRGLRVAAAVGWRTLILVVLGFLVIWVAAKLHVVVIPLVIALLLSALLSPVVDLLTRARLHRTLASAIVLVGGMAIVAGVLTLVIDGFVNGSEELTRNAAGGIKEIQDWLNRPPFNVQPQQFAGFPAAVQDWAQDHAKSGVLYTANTLGKVVTGIFLVLFSTFFFLRDGRKITTFLLRALPRSHRTRITSAADESWNTLVNYVRATVLVAFIDAVGIGLALVICHVNLAYALAALVFLGAFVPIIGATLSGAVAVLVALVDRGPVIAIIILISVIAVQQLEGHVLQPLIMGRAVAIHPLAVILAIAAGGVLAGIIGALIAVPIVAVLNTGIRHLIALRVREEGGPASGPTPPTGPPIPGSPAPTAPPA